ncbi:ABC transporter substrate-binding protein [Biostraticola tofi]|uniref:Iron complex transport system substrate-binding protein n=1 Tax=Biostraticola tofi TaxID=466109 RepID=A0A4V2W4Q2_9GAMM|nr:ABC transporter substrate-binding protein [Biostraticola tofi]TCV96799.1 iron complex transport system substrate-binding protein [Biostraticola tofi]
MIRALALSTVMLAASAASLASPLTLANCGQQWRFEHVPERAIVYSHSALENMLALGLASSIISVVGYSKQQDSTPAPWMDTASLKARFDRSPWSGEAVLAARPDFIYSGSFYWFNSPETPSRQRLQRWGIATWLSESLCDGLQTDSKNSLTFADIFAEVRTIGRIYHVQSRAEQVIRALRQQIDGQIAQAREFPRRRLVWWYTGTDTPYVAGGHGAPSLLTQAIGSENVFADSPALWPTMSWEVIAERDPDIIVIGDLHRGGPGDSAADKIAFLERHPLTAGMTAVKNRRYIILSGYDMDPSVRSIPALKRLVEQMQSIINKED